MTHPMLAWRWRRGFAALAICASATATAVLAQQATPQAQQATPRADQSIRTGDGMLAIQARFPAEVHTGQQFTYEVTVQNATDNVTLHDVRLRHTEGNGLTVESIRQADAEQPQPEPAAAQPSAQPQPQQPAVEQPAAEPSATEQPQPADSEQPRPAAEQPEPTAEQQQQQQAGDNRTLAIDKLEPGQSRTFLVTASADQDGPVQACLLVESYLPAICLQATAVKPELNIVKAAPEQSQLCDVIELVYTVQNDGTGAVGRFEIIDELADGLRTIDGDERLAFAVDELAAGDTRRFVARVYATRTGQFNSRAEARATESDLQSRSENVGPNVVGADLDVTLEGRGAVPSNTPAVFTASVTNTGNAVAENVQVVIRYPEAARLRQLSEPQMTQGNEPQAAQPDQQAAAQQQAQQAAAQQTSPDPAAVEQASAQRSAETPDQRGQQAAGQPEQPADDPAQQQAAAAQSPGSAAAGEQSFTIARLEPGQSAQFDYVLVGRSMDRIETQVEAQYVCELEGAVDLAESEARKTAQATAATRILRLSALQVYVVDEADPVATDQQVVYVIRVLNEGDAPDQNVAVAATLPGQLQFASAEGASEFQQQEQQVTFEPVAELAPGDELEYRVTATAAGQGNVQIQVEVNSQNLDSAVRVAEPTQLYAGEATAEATE